MTNGTAALTGGCQCGAVRFASYCEPGPTSICHCRMCQKAVAGPFGSFIEINRTDFAWTRGSPATFRSSSIAERDFCAACGTPLSYRNINDPTIQILTGALDHPELAVPEHETGIESKLPWLAKLNELPSRTTEQNDGFDQAAHVVSYQHPDHNT